MSTKVEAIRDELFDILFLIDDDSNAAGLIWDAIRSLPDKGYDSVKDEAVSRLRGVAARVADRNSAAANHIFDAIAEIRLGE